MIERRQEAAPEPNYNAVPTADLPPHYQLQRAFPLWSKSLAPGAKNMGDVVGAMIEVEQSHNHAMSVVNMWALRIERAGYFGGDATFTITEDLTYYVEPKLLANTHLPDPTVHDAFLMSWPPYELYVEGQRLAGEADGDA